MEKTRRNRTLQKMMDFPDTDQFASDALTAPQGGEPHTRTIRLTRRWRNPADEKAIDVIYRRTDFKRRQLLSAQVGNQHISLDDPVMLEPVIIVKPWGREIWFSGIEARGESRVRSDSGSLALSTYLALAPERLCRRRSPVLLKILDPRPEPLVGELYLEVHEQKREVYVVSRIDPAAWPDGEGRMRFAVDQSERSAYPDDQAFRSAFLAAVQRYETARAAVDAGVDGGDDSVTTAAASDVIEEQAAAREATDRFIAERPLRVGDVISVPTWVPHSLQHGVQVIEFQTPTYERHIISSAQQVVTQSSWDSATAIAGMKLEPPLEAGPESVAAGVDRIVAFEDFSVWRATLSTGNSIRLPDKAPYAVAFCISGCWSLEGPGQALTLASGQAAFVPAGAVGHPISATEPGILLLAAPGL